MSLIKTTPWLLAILITCFFVNFNLIAQQNPCGFCEIALSTPDQKKYSSFSKVVEAYAKIFIESIDSESYYSRASNYGLIVPPYGSASYKEQKRKYSLLYKDVLLDESYNFSEIQKIEISTIMNNPRAYESFDKCIENCNLGNSQAIYIPLDSTQFEIHILPKTSYELRKLKLTDNIVDSNSRWIGGSLKIPTNRILKLRVNRPYIARFERFDPKESCEITLSVEGQPPYVFKIEPFKRVEQQVPVQYITHDTKMVGSMGGNTDFRHEIINHSINNVIKVSKINIWIDSYVRALQVVWLVQKPDGTILEVPSKKYGGPAGTKKTLALGQDEYVEKVKCKYQAWIDKIFIKTNKKWYSFGGPGGHVEKSIDLKTNEGKEFFGFYGVYQNSIDRLGLIYRTKQTKPANLNKHLKLKEKALFEKYSK